MVFKSVPSTTSFYSYVLILKSGSVSSYRFLQQCIKFQTQLLEMSQKLFKKWIGSDSAFTIDMGKIFCLLCGKVVVAPKKFQFDQHRTSQTHSKLVEQARMKQSKQPPNASKQPPIASMLNSMAECSETNQFNRDLCEAMLKANIPLNKLNNKCFTSFLKKYTNQTIPNESTLRKNYINPLYEKVVEDIRKDIGDSSIWISIDETTDPCGRYLANVIVGKLDSTEPGRGHLISCKELEKANHSTIARTVSEALNLLWGSQAPQYGEERLLALVSDSAAYMLKAGEYLKAFYPKMIHITCLAHGVHRVAEELRINLREINTLISSAKKMFVKAPSRVRAFKNAYPNIPLPPEPIITRWGTWISAANYYAEHHLKLKAVLEQFEESDNQAIAKVKAALNKPSVVQQLAFVKANFGKLPDLITSLETKGVDVCKSVSLVDKLLADSKEWKGPVGENMRKKLDAVLRRNPGWKTIQQLSQILNGEVVGECELMENVSAEDVANYRFLPIVSCDVERSFFTLKTFLSENRRSFKVGNLEKVLVVNCNFNQQVDRIEPQE